MGPQTSIPISATVLGLIGTILWSCQLCPQIWHSYRSKSTDGLPAAMMLLWSWSGLPFGIYAISQNFNIGLQIQPQCFGLLCMVSWAQVMHYGRKWKTWKAVTVAAFMLAINGALQVTFVLVIRGPYSSGVAWPVELVGILATIILLAGYAPIPWELAKRRGRVVGISFLFLAMDWSGAVFSLMSLVAQNTFDVLFGTLYTLCAAIELSMVISHGIWYLRTRKIRQRAEEAGFLTYDEYPEAIEWQENGMIARWLNSGSHTCCGKENGARDGGIDIHCHGISSGDVEKVTIDPELQA